MMLLLGILCVLSAAFSLVLLVQNRRLRRGLSAPAVPPARSEDPDHALFLKMEALLDGEQLYLDPSLDRERLCSLLGIEKNRIATFNRAFRADLGLSPTAWLRRERLQGR